MADITDEEKNEGPNDDGTITPPHVEVEKEEHPHSSPPVNSKFSTPPFPNGSKFGKGAHQVFHPTNVPNKQRPGRAAARGR